MKWLIIPLLVASAFAQNTIVFQPNSSSTSSPAGIYVFGTYNGVAIDSSGNLTARGTGSIAATTTTGNAATATALATTPAQCSAGQFGTGITADGTANCAQVAYSSLSGAPTLPANTPAVSHQVLTAYNSTTGAFSQAQLAYSDISSTPQLPVTKSAVASNFFTSYTSGTGAFTAAQPACADLSNASAFCSGTAWSNLTSTPTTVAGYGITDAVSTARTVGGTSPIGGGGALSGNLLLTCSTCATTTNGGALSATSPATISAAGVIAVPVFVAAGVGHASGLVPDPGAGGGSTRFLREDATWVAPSGSGTVTSFSSGNLSPLFTTSVATATSTPALSFSISNAAANTVFGNNTGSSAAPGFQSLTAGQMPAFTGGDCTTSAGAVSITCTQINGANFTVNTSGLVTKSDGITTAGQGNPIIQCITSQKSESAADTNVLTCTPASAAGSYRIRVYIAVSAQSSATLGWTATWTDSNGSAQAPTNLSLFKTGTAAPALTFVVVTNGNYFGEAQVDVNNAGTNIVVKLTFSGTSFTAKMTATIERII